MQVERIFNDVTIKCTIGKCCNSYYIKFEISYGRSRFVMDVEHPEIDHEDLRTDIMDILHKRAEIRFKAVGCHNESYLSMDNDTIEFGQIGTDGDNDTLISYVIPLYDDMLLFFVEIFQYIYKL